MKRQFNILELIVLKGVETGTIRNVITSCMELVAYDYHIGGKEKSFKVIINLNDSGNIMFVDISTLSISKNLMFHSLWDFYNELAKSQHKSAAVKIAREVKASFGFKF